jgi:IPT/TIG domain
MRPRRTVTLLVTALALLACAGVAAGYFTATTTTGGSGAASAASVGQGATPTTTLVGQSVTVSWTASTLSNGHAVDGYLVRRYDTNGNLQTIGSGCSGTIAALNCTEAGVPAGGWQYTVTPLIGSNWVGQESAKSATVTIVTAAITLGAASGHVGDAVSVSGSGYPASSTITATYDGAALTLNGTTTTTSGGAIPANVSFAVPASTAGTHTVLVSAGGQSAGATFTVHPQIALTPNNGVAGTSDTITATGFAASSSLTATFGGSAVALTPSTTSSSGGLTATYTVPGQATGMHTVVVSDASSNSASATYTINTPSISLTPGAANVGATVAVSGSNFPAGSALTATYDGGALTLQGTTTTTASGAIPAGVTFTVPASTAGGHAVSVSAGGLSAGQTLTVQPQITLTPTSGGAGSSGSISGTGFAAGSALGGTFNGAAITLGGTTSTGANGSFSGATYTVPGDAAGGYTVAVKDASSNGAQATYTITFGPLAKLVLSAAGGNPTAGSADNLTITAEDSAGNTVSSYTGDKSLTFTGASSSPSGTHPTVSDKSGTAVNFGSPATITFAGGSASSGSGKNGVMTLYKAGSASITVTDGSVNNNASPLSVFTNSAGVTLSFSPTCPATVPKNSTTTFTLNFPADAFGNAFTTQTSLAIGLTLTNSGNWGFGTTTGTTGAALNVSTGPANNTFKVTESGANKSSTLTASAPAPFTSPASCSLTSGG